MTSKERVLSTFHHIEPDRVPINYSCNPGIDRRLKEHFHLHTDDDEGLLQCLGVDFRGLVVPYSGPTIHNPVAGRNVDPEWGFRTRWVEHHSGGYWDFCDFPLKDADIDEVENWPMPDPDDYDYSKITDFCKENGKYAIYAGNAGLGDVINMSGLLRSMEQVLIDLALNTKAGLRLIERRIDVQLAVLERTLDAAQGKIDFVWMGEDLGSQNGPLISNELYRTRIKQFHKRIVDCAESYGLPVMIHSCGSSSWAFDDFIEIGIHVIDTLQPEAKDMEPEFLKRKYGDELAFHGCISTAGPVATGTSEDVVDYCRKILEIMMPGGGYCFAPTHQLQDNSPTQNVLAMYNTARQFGSYN